MLITNRTDAPMVYNSGIIYMKKYFVILSVLVLTVFCGCKKDAGEPITREFGDGGSYTELEVSDAFDVTVSDAVNQITVTAGKNVMPNVVVERVGDELIIRLKAFSGNYKNSEMKVVLPYNANLRSVELSGSAHFNSTYGLSGHDVDVDLSGSSEFVCDIAAEEADIDLTGASKMKANVIAGKLDLEMYGASEATLTGQVSKMDMDLYEASDIIKTVSGTRYGLAVGECEGTMLGASNAYIHSDGSIQVNLWGASDLHYTGEASTSGSYTYGGSNIIHDNL